MAGGGGEVPWITKRKYRFIERKIKVEIFCGTEKKRVFFRQRFPNFTINISLDKKLIKKLISRIRSGLLYGFT
jgi:hypothetical protein